jgi:hypothetical protein
LRCGQLHCELDTFIAREQKQTVRQRRFKEDKKFHARNVCLQKDGKAADPVLPSVVWQRSVLLRVTPNESFYQAGSYAEESYAKQHPEEESVGRHQVVREQ